MKKKAILLTVLIAVLLTMSSCDTVAVYKVDGQYVFMPDINAESYDVSELLAMDCAEIWQYIELMTDEQLQTVVQKLSDEQLVALIEKLGGEDEIAPIMARLTDEQRQRIQSALHANETPTLEALQAMSQEELLAMWDELDNAFKTELMSFMDDDALSVFLRAMSKEQQQSTLALLDEERAHSMIERLLTEVEDDPPTLVALQAMSLEELLAVWDQLDATLKTELINTMDDDALLAFLQGMNEEHKQAALALLDIERAAIIQQLIQPTEAPQAEAPHEEAPAQSLVERTLATWDRLSDDEKRTIVDEWNDDELFSLLSALSENQRAALQSILNESQWARVAALLYGTENEEESEATIIPEESAPQTEEEGTDEALDDSANVDDTETVEGSENAEDTDNAGDDNGETDGTDDAENGSVSDDSSDLAHDNDAAHNDEESEETNDSDEPDASEGADETENEEAQGNEAPPAAVQPSTDGNHTLVPEAASKLPSGKHPAITEAHA